MPDILGDTHRGCTNIVVVKPKKKRHLPNASPHAGYFHPMILFSLLYPSVGRAAYPHFTVEQTEALRGEANHLRPFSQAGSGPADSTSRGMVGRKPSSGTTVTPAEGQIAIHVMIVTSTEVVLALGSRDHMHLKFCAWGSTTQSSWLCS